MEYSKLTDYTLACPILAQAIHSMASESGLLNLIDPDWETKLKEYSIYQRHMEKRVPFSKGKACRNDKAYVKNITIPALSYKIIVLASMTCSRVKPDEPGEPLGDLHFVTRECPPLTRIGEAMQETLAQKLHDGARLFMEYCNPALCSACMTAHQQHHMPCDVHRNWCVMKTRMFDGQKMTNAFKKQLEPILDGIGSFLAICQLQIFSRTIFGEDKYKIGGKIKNIIVFQESAIQPRVEMNFMEEIFLPAAIEYTPEEKDEDSVEHVC
ncbi:uncharacterized protein NPIL_18931 [Nephila pilipes]|uniref:Uncharacterized protein n=1 Tax=Nephila pilipes TaxID=299642 RepID=A0A8X6U004_NEPPI|nr:uncharacterized protein NPIL_18931 [Nephila pilipes]